MRSKTNQKEETRRKVLDAAGRGFHHCGYAGIGVDGLAKEAGVTSGAFYMHFGSKREAFVAALEAGLDEVIEALPRIQQEHRADWISAFANYYLGREHREDTECGCAMASLTPEVIRSDLETRSVYEERMNRIVDLMAQGLRGSDGERRSRAWGALGVLIGGLNVARAVKSEALADEIARSITAAAVDVAGETTISDD